MPCVYCGVTLKNQLKIKTKFKSNQISFKRNKTKIHAYLRIFLSILGQILTCAYFSYFVFTPIVINLNL